MIKIKTYPKNKDFFVRLKKFCKEILKICDKAGAKPIAYGSLACFAYTKDKNTVVKDVDLYISEKYFEKIIKILRKKKIKCRYFKKWHAVQAIRGKLKVELDSIEFWYKGSRKLKQMNFNGLKIKVLDLKELTSVYRKASKVKSNPKKYGKKFKILEKLK